MNTNKIEATETATETVIVDKEAFKKLSILVKSNISELEDNPKTAKTLQRFVDVKACLQPVKALINDKVSRINVLAKQVSVLTKENDTLQEMVDNEPVRQVIELRRLVSAFSGVVEVTEATPVDSYYVDSQDANAVLTRIKPIVDVDAGVLGVKISITDTFAHVILFADFIAPCELRERRRFNIDADGADALLVYQEAMSAAFAIADFYAVRFGAFTSIPRGSHHVEEANRIAGALEIGNALVATADEDGEDDGDISEEEDENDGADDSDPTDEDIADRLAGEDDDETDEEEIEDAGM